MKPPDPRCTIRTKIEANAVLFTSLVDLSRRYGKNKKNRILIDNVLEVEIGPKATTSGRRRNFVVAKFDLGEGDTNVATISIMSVNIHTPEYIRPVTNGDGRESDAAATTTTTGLSYIQSLFEFPRRQHQTL